MDRPLISIVIPVYNGSDYLREAIDSALGQTYENCEVIVVNDGSCDGGKTEEAALSYGDQIRYFTKPNGGVAQALNFGIEQMRGEYFSWLSHDDILYPDKIEREFAALMESRAALVFCSYHIFTDGGRRTLVRLSDHFEKSWLERGVFPVLNSLIQFGGCLFHKSLFERYGSFREELKTTQDFEFLFRILKEEKSCYLDEALYGIRYHERQGSRTIESVKQDADEMYLMFLNHINDGQREAAYGSVYNYYYRLYLSILPQKHLTKSMAQCRKKLNELTASMAETGNIAAINHQARMCLKSDLGADGRKIYIYGCGNYGLRLKRDLELRGYAVEGFLDGNPRLWGKTIDGSTCCSVEELDDEREDILVIIASIYVDEIVQELKKRDGLRCITKKTVDRAGMRFPPIFEADFSKESI